MNFKSETKSNFPGHDDRLLWALVRILVFLVTFFAQIFAIRMTLESLSFNPFGILGDFEIVAGGLCNLICAALAIFVSGYGSSVNLKTIGLKANAVDALKHSVIGFLIGGAIISLLVGILSLTGGYSFIGFREDVKLAPYLMLFFFAALAEELVFRGFVFQLFEKSIGSIKALIVASVFFGFAHCINGLSSDNMAIIFACTFLVVEAGIPLNLAYVLSRNLWLPLGIHWSWNFFEGAIFGANVSGLDLKHSLIKAEVTDGILGGGGVFGPESTVAGLFVGIVFSFLFWKQVKKSGALE